MEHPIEENEIELYDYLKILYKYKYFIIIATFVSVVLAVAIADHQKPVISESNIKLKFFFNGIQKGVYPNGTIFSKNDIINPRFLAEAIKSVDVEQYDLEKEELLVNLRPFVREIIPKIAKEKQTKKEADSLGKLEFYADEFIVFLREPEGMDVPNIVREMTLDGITQNLIKWFESKYINKNYTAIYFNKENFSDHEFFNILDLIQENVEKVLLDISKMPEDLKHFKSNESGLNTYDHEAYLKVFLNNDLFYMKSLIEMDSIYKDRLLASKHLQFKLKFLLRNSSKISAQYEFLSSMMERLESSGASSLPALFALMLNNDVGNIPDSEKMKIGESFKLAPKIFQDLAKKSTWIGEEMTSLKEEVKLVRQRIDDIKKTETKTSKKLVKEYDDKMILLSDKAVKIITSLNDLQLELNKKRLKDSIKVVSNPISYQLPRGIKKIALISLVIGLFLSIFLSFFINYIREHIIAPNDGLIK